MSHVFRLKMAKQTAEASLKQEGITSLPVDPFALAASRDIVVQAKADTADGVSGMLLRHADSFGILYATYIPSEGFQRFSIGHELGLISSKDTSITCCRRTDFTRRALDSFPAILTNPRQTILPPAF
jgi:hypothetical protein